MLCNRGVVRRRGATLATLRSPLVRQPILNSQLLCIFVSLKTSNILLEIGRFN